MTEYIFLGALAVGTVAIVAANGMLIEVASGFVLALAIIFILILLFSTEARIGRRQRREWRRGK